MRKARQVVCNPYVVFVRERQRMCCFCSVWFTNSREICWFKRTSASMPSGVRTAPRSVDAWRQSGSISILLGRPHPAANAAERESIISAHAGARARYHSCFIHNMSAIAWYDERDIREQFGVIIAMHTSPGLMEPWTRNGHLDEKPRVNGGSHEAHARDALLDQATHAIATPAVEPVVPCISVKLITDYKYPWYMLVFSAVTAANCLSFYN